MSAVVWWDGMDSFALAGWCLAFAATTAATVGWIKASMAGLWRKRCNTHKETIAGLRTALDDARYQTARRATPAPVTEWTEPVEPRPARFVSVWPGRNPRPLPVAYGLQPEPLELDPCLTNPGLTEPELHAWLAEYAPTVREVQLVEGLATLLEQRAVFEAQVREWVVRIPEEVR